MTCIAALMKVKPEAPLVLIEDGVVLEKAGEYKGHFYAITFQHMGFRCGYVAVSPESPWHRATDFDSLECHGGVTFHDKPDHFLEKVLPGHECPDIWVGFDCGHGFDKNDYKRAAELFPAKANYLREMDSGWQEFNFTRDFQTRTVEYVEENCKGLIDQIISLRPPVTEAVFEEIKQPGTALCVVNSKQ